MGAPVQSHRYPYGSYARRQGAYHWVWRMNLFILAKKGIPKKTPSVRDVLRQGAIFGGFLGRKGDGEASVKAFWLGMQRLRDFVEGMAHMQTIFHAR